MEKGKLQLISGPMFSGKSKQLIKIFNSLIIEIEDFSSKVKIFKPKIDIRSKNIESRVGWSIKSEVIDSSEEILKKITKHTKYIFIDEFQFFDNTFYKVIEKLLLKGIDVYVSGLDNDFKRNEFKRYTELKKLAAFEIKTTAICLICSKIAINSKLLSTTSKTKGNIIIEKQENSKYISCCSNCF